MAARDCFRQKPIDQCCIEKCLQSRVHPPLVDLFSGKCHCINHWNESIPHRSWQRQTGFLNCAEESRLFFTLENFKWLERKVMEALGIEKLHQRPI